MKRILSLLLSVFMVLSLVGCASDNVGQGNNAGGNTGGSGGETSGAGAEFPGEKPITIVCYYDPGGGADVAARILASVAPDILGQRVDVVNMPGGGGLEAFDYLMKQPQDGYTLLVGSMTFLNMGLTQDVPYDLDDFVPLMGMSKSVPIIFSKGDGPYQTIQDVVDACKAKPESVSVGHGRVNSGVHVTLKSLESAAGIRTANVPTTGGAEALSFVLGGHVDCGVSVPSTLAASIASGEITALAVADEERWDTPELADVPTLKELGYEVVLPSNYYVMAWGDVPQERIDFLSEKLREAMGSETAAEMCEGANIISAADLTMEDCIAQWEGIRETMTEYYRGTGELYE